MTSDGQMYVTSDGLQKLKDELKHLKSVKRKEIASRIQEAKELGDLSENAEYAEAKTEQAFVEGRIMELENTLKNAVVIATEEGATAVRIGSTVVVSVSGKDQTYTIVGSNEADPTKHLISNESPLGQAFIGRKIGDTVDIRVPKGTVSYKIIKIS